MVTEQGLVLSWFLAEVLQLAYNSVTPHPWRWWWDTVGGSCPLEAGGPV